MKLPKDLVAASATPFILSILSIQDSYGYDIIQKVRDVSGGKLEWADGMLYPILHRLELKSLIESYQGFSSTGRKRKYYRICQAGIDELKLQRANWESLSLMLKDIERGQECFN